MPGLLSDQMLSALRLHLACTHGGLFMADPDPRGLSPNQQRLVRELMLHHSDHELRLADLARFCHMPVHRFGQAFRMSFGMSPHRWRLRARLESARTLLEQRRLPIVQIAQVCGFYDQAHFTRCFARSVGLTPALYRRSHQGK